VPSARGCSEMDKTGGLRPTTVKKDTGAMLHDAGIAAR
jgi:hypothetical protein